MLSYSQIQSWTRCKRKWYLAQIVGLEPVELAGPLKRGGIASDVLDLVHTGDANPLAPIKKAYSIERESEDKVERDLAALEGVFTWYIGSEYAEMKGRTQYHWEWKEPDYPRLQGYLDLMYPNEDSIAYEFKYTGNPDNYSRFTLQDQLSAYFLGVPTLQRITLRAIQTPTLKPTKGESQNQYIERVLIDCKRQPKKYVTDTHYWRSEFDLEAYREKARWVAKEIVEACDRGEKGCYQNLNACYAPGQCEFLKVCEGGGAVSETLYRYKEKKEGNMEPRG